MKELFVPYEESLALRELGFDEPTNYLYNSSHDTPEAFPCDTVGIWKDWNSIYRCGLTKHLLSAPLYQQVFEWFRKKHGLICEITYEIENFYFNIKSISNKYDNYEILLSLRNRNEWAFKSYEDAQIACLQNMIEIVKNKE
jgi:hypothetical protein